MARTVLGLLVILTISGIVSADPITFVLDVGDPDCAYLRNLGDTMATFYSSYEIRSEAGLLNPDGFCSIFVPDFECPYRDPFDSPLVLVAPGGGMAMPAVWASEHAIGETDGTCSTWGLPAGESVALGPIAPGVPIDDLTFSQGGVIPEPASIALLALSAAAVIRKRRQIM